MYQLKTFEIWFVTGSQDLYGETTLKQVAEHSTIIANHLDLSPSMPFRVVYKNVMKSSDDVTQVMQEANHNVQCIGVITWMHTFSPSKMWITGLNILQKPLLHLHTQYNSDIPFDKIDMDFMNLNQSAHGDREFGFMLSRIGKSRKTVVGHWQSKSVIDRMAIWARVSFGVAMLKKLKVVRFGDNMRYVGVTEGDKVEAELKFGFSVNTYGVADLVKVIDSITEYDVKVLMNEYEDSYVLMDSLKANGQQRDALFQAAKIELGIKYFLTHGGFNAYTNTFEDLNGMRQLPGIGSQRMMAAGYGFSAEGDWKTSAMVYLLKTMAVGLPGGNSFMEDYTYHFNPTRPMVLGSHMLEICPSIATSPISCEVHPLGIGGKEDPVRLVFNGAQGPAINVSLIDMGNRFRLLVNEVDGMEITEHFPKLPTARVLWQPKPNMEIGLQAWLMAGGAHHTVYSQNITTEYLEDFAEMMGIELVVIDQHTNIRSLKNELKMGEIIYQ